MKLHYILLILFVVLCSHCALEKDNTVKIEDPVIPHQLIGFFEDDYQIQYSVSDSTFILLPNSIYHIKSWNIDEQYLIAFNDSSNSYDPGLWTRIDWIELNDMEPFSWAFCISVFNAETFQQAELGGQTNSDTPMTGCNGFPFSRMKRIETINSENSSY